MKLSKAELAAVVFTVIFIVITVVSVRSARDTGAAVTVSTQTAASAEAASSAPVFSDAPDALVNINTASAGLISTLPGIGEMLAARIVSYRGEHGDFSNIEDIMSVSGIGAKTYEQLKDHITVN